MRDTDNHLMLTLVLLSSSACSSAGNEDSESAKAMTDQPGYTTSPTTDTAPTPTTGMTSSGTGSSSTASSSSTSSSSTTISMTTEESTTTEVDPCSDGVIDLPGGTGGTSGSDTGETDTAGDNTGGEGVECDEGLDDENNSKNTAEPYSKEQPKEGDSNCTPDCKVARYCGDGVVDTMDGEECDGGNECWNCLLDRRVFVTSAFYCGDMGIFNNGCTSNGKGMGVARGDARCNEVAKSAKPPLGKKMKAWLSTGAGDQPDKRFNAAAAGKKFEGRYVMVKADKTEVVVAYGWAGLIGGELKHAINIDENGLQHMDGTAWTNTTTLGEVSDAIDSCGAWGSPSSNDNGRFGKIAMTDQQWTAAGAENCSNAKRLYCFEDPDPAP